MFTKKPERDPGKPDQPAASPTFGAPPLPAPSPAAQPAAEAKPGARVAPSIIGDDLTVTGNVISKGEVQVEGEVQGDIHCTSLLIGDKAQIAGGVVADDVVVRGRVVGSIRGKRVTLQTSSHVEGDVYHQSLAIEQGAFFEGKSRRSDDPTAGSEKNPAAMAKTAAAASGAGPAPVGEKPSDPRTQTPPRAAE